MVERAVAIGEKTLGPDDLHTAMSLLRLAYVLVEAGDDDDALRVLERVVRINDAHEGVPTDELEARFALAKVLIATGGDRARARALAEQARDGWRTSSEGNSEALAEVESSLVTHAPRK